MSQFKKIYNDKFTIFVDSIAYLKVDSDIVGDNIVYNVLAVLKSNNQPLAYGNPNVFILNSGFNSEDKAIRFKEILENKIDTNWLTISLEDIDEEVEEYFRHKEAYESGERQSTMTDLGQIPSIRERRE